MKKLLAISLILIMIISFTTVTYAVNDGLVISECGYMSRSGEKIESLNEETAVKGYAKIVNSASDNGGFAMFLAQYDKYGKLTAMKVKPISYTSDTYEATFVTPLIETTAGDGSYFKLFITKDFGEIQPLANVPALTAGKKDAYSLTISSDDYEKATMDTNDVITVEYWENPTDRKSTLITVAKNPMVYVNGGLQASTSTDAIKELDKYYGYASFQKYNTYTTEDYDTIFIESFETMIVDTVSTSRYTVTSKNDTKTIHFDPSDSSYESTLYDADGKEMKWEDLKEWDMISIKRYDNGIKEIVTGNVTTTTVTGTVTSVSDEWTDDVMYLISGKRYGIDPNAIDSGEISLGDEGTFYIDVMGNIIYYKPLPPKYAYIVKVGSNGSAIDLKYALKMYTSDGNYGVKELASKVTIDGISGINGYSDITSAITVNKSAAESRAILFKQGAEWFNMSDDDCINSIKPIEPGQVITYTVNSDGYITSIDRAADKTNFLSVTGKFTYAANRQNLTYNAASETLSGSSSGSIYITDKTIIMIAPTMDADGNVVQSPTALTKDDFALISISDIIDGQELLQADIYDVDDNREAGLIVVNTNVEIPEPRSVMALVKGIDTAIDDDGNYVYNLKVLQNGIVKDGTDNEPLVTTDDDSYGVCAYDTIIPKYDLAGKVKGAVRAASLNGYGSVVFNAPADTDKVKYCYGKVTDINRKLLELDNGKSIDVMNTTNVYVYDAGASYSNKVTIDDIDVIYFESDGQCYIGNDSCDAYVIAREYEGAIVDLVLYIFRK